MIRNLDQMLKQTELEMKAGKKVDRFGDQMNFYMVCCFSVVEEKEKQEDNYLTSVCEFCCYLLSNEVYHGTDLIAELFIGWNVYLCYSGLVLQFCALMNEKKDRISLLEAENQRLRHQLASQHSLSNNGSKGEAEKIEQTAIDQREPRQEIKQARVKRKAPTAKAKSSTGKRFLL